MIQRNDRLRSHDIDAAPIGGKATGLMGMAKEGNRLGLSLEMRQCVILI